MPKTKETLEFEKYLKKYTHKQGIFSCPEVTIGWFGHERVDYLTYDTNDIFKCYEVKVTKTDFYSKCHNTFIGNYNYYNNLKQNIICKSTKSQCCTPETNTIL